MLPTVTAISPWPRLRRDRGMPQVSWIWWVWRVWWWDHRLSCRSPAWPSLFSKCDLPTPLFPTKMLVPSQRRGSIWINLDQVLHRHFHPPSSTFTIWVQEMSIWRPQRSALKSSTPWPSNALTKSTCTWTAHELHMNCTWTAHELHKLKSPLKKRLVTDPLIDWQATFNLGHILSQTCSLTSTPTDSHC